MWRIMECARARPQRAPFLPMVESPHPAALAGEHGVVGQPVRGSDLLGRSISSGVATTTSNASPRWRSDWRMLWLTSRFAYSPALTTSRSMSLFRPSSPLHVRLAGGGRQRLLVEDDAPVRHSLALASGANHSLRLGGARVGDGGVAPACGWPRARPDSSGGHGGRAGIAGGPIGSRAGQTSMTTLPTLRPVSAWA
jgi:hypothetical protein